MRRRSRSADRRTSTTAATGAATALRHAVTFVAAVAVASLLFPVGVQAAGQLVNIADPNDDTKIAKVTGGHLWVGDAKPPLTIDGTVGVHNISTADGVEPLRVSSAVRGTELVHRMRERVRSDRYATAVLTDVSRYSQVRILLDVGCDGDNVAARVTSQVSYGPNVPAVAVLAEFEANCRDGHTRVIDVPGGLIHVHWRALPGCCDDADAEASLVIFGHP